MRGTEKLRSYLIRGCFAVVAAFFYSSCSTSNTMEDAPLIDKDTAGLGETKELGVLGDSGSAAVGQPLEGPLKLEGLNEEKSRTAKQEAARVESTTPITSLSSADIDAAVEVPSSAPKDLEKVPVQPQATTGSEGTLALTSVDSVTPRNINTASAEPQYGTTPDSSAAPLLMPPTEDTSFLAPPKKKARKVAHHGGKRHHKRRLVAKASAKKAAPAPATKEEAPIAAAPAAATALQSFKTPSVPVQAVSYGGQLVNRYYFLRMGENAENLSMFLYGASDRANDLKTWNKDAKWEPGTIIVYASPKNPTDLQMKSFFEENSVLPRKRVVTQGDTLLTLAKEEYRDEKSWQEIAVVNHLMDGRPLQPGQELVLMPENLAAYSAPTRSLASNNAPISAAAGTAPPPMKTPDPKEAQLASTIVAPFFVRHLGLALVLGSSVLFVAFILLRRVRSRNDDIDF